MDPLSIIGSYYYIGTHMNRQVIEIYRRHKRGAKEADTAYVRA